MATYILFNTFEAALLDGDSDYSISLLTPYIPSGIYQVTVNVDGLISAPSSYEITENTGFNMLTPVLTHSEDAINNLLFQYKGKPNLLALHQSLYADEIQELSNSAQSLSRRFNIDLSYGDNLDRIGEIIGLSRNGLNDIYYRQFLKAKALVNSSNGSINTIIRIVRYLTNADSIQLINGYEESTGSSAGYRLIITESSSSPIDPNQYSNIFNLILDATSLGIGLSSIIIENGEDNFSLGDLPVGPATEVIDIYRGLGDENNSITGGKFVTMIFG